LLAIPKYAYQHPFPYFPQTFQYSEQQFHYSSHPLHDILQPFTNLHYPPIKIPITNNKPILLSIIQKLHEINAIQLQIKKQL
ncbi:DUF6005 family protein, partial [Bacillus thuringiensis]|uniref:DUF6005 family protein n=1 Tax=Bacillus thuringiensis TaxID=1428 RepID=UPI001C92C8BE